jgi:hypothetical protein
LSVIKENVADDAGREGKESLQEHVVKDRAFETCRIWNYA